ncbi:MAG: PIN domain-containing protein [Rhodobacter sp.]|nr:PIN domain-containing protein [Rhodobacter sp.]
MKALLDACVLYPTVMREVLLAVAGQGLFTPLWSDRILEEWARAARKLGPEGETLARGDIALIRAAWPNATIPRAPGIEARLWLPDQHDIHVLASAIAGSAEVLLTVNAQDFPQNALAAEGLVRRDPDRFLWQLWSEHPDRVADAVARVQATAERLSGEAQPLRKLLKKARLPRLGKALS